MHQLWVTDSIASLVAFHSSLAHVRVYEKLDPTPLALKGQWLGRLPNAEVTMVSTPHDALSAPRSLAEWLQLYQLGNDKYHPIRAHFAQPSNQEDPQ